MDDEKNFCEQCGHPLGAEAKYCRACGHQVAPAVSTPREAEPAKLPRRQSRLPWIFCGVAVVMLGGAAAGYYWGSSGDKPGPRIAVSLPVTKEPKKESQPQPLAQTDGGRPSKASGDVEKGSRTLPPPPEVDIQKEFKPLPPPPPLDQSDEAILPLPPPLDSSRNLPAGTSGGPRWSWTSQRPVTTQDLSRLSPGELVLMRNEIYARHGWVFQRVDLQNYFGQQLWYHPKGTLENREAGNRLAEAEMTPLERQNIKTILQYEKVQQGGR